MIIEDWYWYRLKKTGIDPGAVPCFLFPAMYVLAASLHANEYVA